MQHKLKIAATLMVLCGAFLSGHAQQTYTASFTYDLNGNRILRQVVIGNGNKDIANNGETITPVIDTFDALSITLFPNPTEGKFSICIPNLETDAVIWATITNTIGAVICNRQLSGPTEQFDLTQQPAGIYLLRLAVNGESHTWKVIKN